MASPYPSTPVKLTPQMLRNAQRCLRASASYDSPLWDSWYITYDKLLRDMYDWGTLKL